MLPIVNDGVSFPLGWDSDNTTWKQLGDNVALIPRTLLIDKKGIIRYVLVGGNEGNLAAIVQKIGELLEE